MRAEKHYFHILILIKNYINHKNDNNNYNNNKNYTELFVCGPEDIDACH